MNEPHVRHDSFIRETWSKYNSLHTHLTHICETPFIHACDMAHYLPLHFHRTVFIWMSNMNPYLLLHFNCTIFVLFRPFVHLVKVSQKSGLQSFSLANRVVNWFSRIFNQPLHVRFNIEILKSQLSTHFTRKHDCGANFLRISTRSCKCILMSGNSTLCRSNEERKREREREKEKETACARARERTTKRKRERERERERAKTRKRERERNRERKVYQSLHVRLNVGQQRPSAVERSW